MVIMKQMRVIMYKHCTTEAGTLRQRQLEQNLLELMADHPLDQITIGDICARAGLSRKTFYRYFDSKDGCLHALLDHTIMDGSTYYMPGTGSEDPAMAFCCRIFEYWQSQTALLDALERNGQSVQILQRVVRYVLEEEPEYARFLGVGDDCAIEHIVYAAGGVMALILNWHHDHYQKTAAQMGGILHHMILPQQTRGGT